MKKIRTEDRLILYALAACLVLACIGLITAPRGENRPSDYQGNPASQSQKGPSIGTAALAGLQTTASAPNTERSGNSPQNDWLAWIETNSGAFQAIFDGILVFVGFLQWFIYRTIRDDSVAKERAFLFLNDISGIPDTTMVGQTGIFQICPKWENSGSTPAIKVWVQVNVEIRDNDLPHDFSFPDRWEPNESMVRHPLFIAPKSSVFGSIRNIPGHLIPLVFYRQKRIFVYGWCDYNDVFSSSKRHRTEFCREMTVTAFNILTGQSTIRFGGYGVHNGIDDNCTRKPMPYIAPPQGTPIT